MEFLEEEDFTVLLYYQYCEIEDPPAILQWQQEVCEANELKGRIRISPEGLNGTLGGTRAGVEAYIRSFDLHPELNPASIHWKVSKATTRYSLEEQQFLTLSCKITKEVVSLDLPPAERELMIAAGPGQHLTPEQFHEVIAKAAAENKNEDMEEGMERGVSKYVGMTDSKLVLIDVRNIYETEIGRFACPGGIPVLDPKTRKFKDFKDYIDTNKHELKSKQVLMYCTGGVRCERASAYLRLCGIQDVSQLSGGIHAYQEAYPNGDGFFRGKNFVYDRRIAVPCRNRPEVIGECRLCGVSYDDYKPQVRCVCCRMLQLVCDKCRSSSSSSSSCSAARSPFKNTAGENSNCEEDEVGNEVSVICALCEQKGRMAR